MRAAGSGACSSWHLAGLPTSPRTGMARSNRRASTWRAVLEPASFRPGAVWRAEARLDLRAAGDGKASPAAVGRSWHWHTRRTARPWPRPETTPSSCLRDVATGRVTGRLEGHRDAVACLSFSPDGKTLATGSYDRTVKLWDVSIRPRQGHAHRAYQLGFLGGLF